MSHQATNWAIKQRGIKPASKIVLWYLCDRYHPDNGCFPSQETLAFDCEMSRASINRCLDELEAKGLIERHQRIDPVSKKQVSTSYSFNFDNSVSQFDARVGVAVSQKTQKPCLKKRKSRVSICDTNLVIEPVRRTSNNADANLFGEKEDLGKVNTLSDAFDEFWKAYPKKAGKPAAQKAFQKAIKNGAAPDAIITGAKRYALWLSTGGPKDFRPTVKFPQGWLNDERWNDADLPELPNDKPKFAVGSPEDLAERRKRLSPQFGEVVR